MRIVYMTAVGFEPTQLALVELESTPLGDSGKLFCKPQVAGCSSQNRENSKASVKVTLAGLEPAIFGSEDQRLIH